MSLLQSRGYKHSIRYVILHILHTYQYFILLREDRERWYTSPGNSLEYLLKKL